jgi:hypothetical protein
MGRWADGRMGTLAAGWTPPSRPRSNNPVQTPGDPTGVIAQGFEFAEGRLLLKPDVAGSEEDIRELAERPEGDVEKATELRCGALGRTLCDVRRG